jgi:hypothetical protein
LLPKISKENEKPCNRLHDYKAFDAENRNQIRLPGLCFVNI